MIHEREETHQKLDKEVRKHIHGVSQLPQCQRKDIKEKVELKDSVAPEKDPTALLSVRKLPRGAETMQLS